MAKMITQKGYLAVLSQSGIEALLDHGLITGRDDDDHTIYLLADGSRILSADWDIGDGRVLKGDKIQARDGAGLILANDAGNAGVQINDDGSINKPLQPSFSVSCGSVQTDLVAAGWRTLEFDTEVFDVGSNFNTGTYTFTAPVAGKYVLSVFQRFEEITTNPSQIYIRIGTSNRDYVYITAPFNIFGSEVSAHTMQIHCVADMDVSDTAIIYFYQAGGANTVDTSNSASYSRFSGYLLG